MADSKTEGSAPTEITLHGLTVMLSAEPGIDVQKALDSDVFKNWTRSLQKELVVSAVHFQSMDMFGKRVGFLKFRATASFNGTTIPGIVFARGGAVGILPVLSCNSKKYVVLTVQPRVPLGEAASIEVPAGMLDGDGHFAGVAAKEMREETGLEMSDSDLFDLTQAAGTGGLVPSGGGCDEKLRLFLYRTTVDESKLHELQGKCTGCLDEGEVISLKIVPYEDVWHVTGDAKALAAMFLYERLFPEDHRSA